MNTLQRIAGALGTALFAILLRHAITASQAQHPGSVPAVALRSAIRSGSRSR